MGNKAYIIILKLYQRVFKGLCLLVSLHGFSKKNFLVHGYQQTKWRFIDTHFKYEIICCKVGGDFIAHINSEYCVYLCKD